MCPNLTYARSKINTRFEQSEILSALADPEFYFKFENFQLTTFFEDRGTLNKLLALRQALACQQQ